MPNNVRGFFRQPLLQLALSSLLFGLGAVFVVFIELSPAVIAFYRLLIGAILFALVLFFQRQSLTGTPAAIGFALLSGVFLGADLGMWNAGIMLVGPGIATILNSLQVFFMAAFGIIFFKDKPTVKLWVSLLITFAGIILLCSNEINHNQSGYLGVIVGILSGLMFAASMLCLREAAKRQSHSLVSTMFYASVGGMLATGLYGVVTAAEFFTNDIISWIMIAVYGSVVHVFAWFLMAKAMPHVALALVGLVMCLEPVTVFFIDVTLLQKPLIIWQYLGAGLTVAAIYLGSQASSGKAS